MRQPITITLADREYSVRPLTLGTIRSIDLTITGGLPTEPREREEAMFDRYLTVLSAALVEDAPEMTVDKLLTLRTTLDEVLAAFRQVMVHSGLVQENPPMDQAAVATQPTGPTSTGG